MFAFPTTLSPLAGNVLRLGAGRGSQMLVRVRTLESPTGLSAGVHPALCQTARYATALDRTAIFEKITLNILENCQNELKSKLLKYFTKLSK